MELLLNPWRNALNVGGRMRRLEYMLFLIQLVVVGTALASVLIATAPVYERNAGIGFVWLGLGIILTLAILVLAVIAAIRRAHDFNGSGFIVFVIVLAGWLAFLVFGFIPGTAGPNQFGPEPKGRPGNIGNVFS